MRALEGLWVLQEPPERALFGNTCTRDQASDGTAVWGVEGAVESASWYTPWGALLGLCIFSWGWQLARGAAPPRGRRIQRGV